MWGPRSIAKLVHITPISLFWFIVLITLVTGAYKPTNITGGAHIVGLAMKLNDPNEYSEYCQCQCRSRFRMFSPWRIEILTLCLSDCLDGFHLCVHCLWPLILAPRTCRPPAGLSSRVLFPCGQTCRSELVRNQWNSQGDENRKRRVRLSQSNCWAPCSELMPEARENARKNVRKNVAIYIYMYILYIYIYM